MQLPVYKSAISIPLTEEQVEIRKQFVTEYIRDPDPRRALLRMGQPASLVNKMAELYMADNWVQLYLQEAWEAFGVKVANKDPKFIGLILARLYNEGCNSPKDSVRLGSISKLVDLLNVQTIQPVSDISVKEMTPEQVKDELLKRGHNLPDKIYDDKFGRKPQ